MKIIFALFLCAFFGLPAFAQTVETPPDSDEVTVADISLAKDDGNGKPGEVVEKFKTTDVPVHCLVQLSSIKSVTVKLNLVAVKANGLKLEASIVTVSYKINGNQNRARFNVSPEKNWSAGKYRADIFLNGKLAKSLEFDIEKSAADIEKDKQTPPKITAKPKNFRKPKKN